MPRPAAQRGVDVACRRRPAPKRTGVLSSPDRGRGTFCLFVAKFTRRTDPNHQKIVVAARNTMLAASTSRTASSRRRQDGWSDLAIPSRGGRARIGDWFYGSRTGPRARRQSDRSCAGRRWDCPKGSIAGPIGGPGQGLPAGRAKSATTSRGVVSIIRPFPRLCGCITASVDRAARHTRCVRAVGQRARSRGPRAFTSCCATARGSGIPPASFTPSDRAATRPIGSANFECQLYLNLEIVLRVETPGCQALAGYFEHHLPAAEISPLDPHGPARPAHALLLSAHCSGGGVVKR